MNCTVLKTYHLEQGLSKKFQELFWISFYFFNPKISEIETLMFQIDPDPKLVVGVWNVLSEIFVMKKYIKLVIPSVKEHFKICVPKLFKPILFE